MSLALVLPGRGSEGLAKRLKALDEQLDIQLWPDCPAPQTVAFAVTWQPPAGALAQFPNLKVVQSLGAGVDGLAAELPSGVTLCRTISPNLKTDMRDYVLLAILAEQRQWQATANDQTNQHWQQRHYRRGGCVGVMGLGELGGYVAGQLAGLGFSVKGWSRSPRQLPGIDCFSGEAALGEFLTGLDYLVCLLPLTPQTQGLMNSAFFAQLNSAPYLIHVGRGAQLDEQALLAALDGGQLRGACLDVFIQEPLPRQHPFWRHPTITVTPHNASITSGNDLARVVYQNYLAMRQGTALNHVVNSTLGY
ncbi:2-hydroxyacid dehydrogenase [Gallaecimonas pentaromativorans]|uniref:2-hydroxyacid dehydrogenase n=1 Tax=Gallaecimonas pentaromativorans TaxID=584787 RepID=UPI003A8DD08E